MHRNARARRSTGFGRRLRVLAAGLALAIAGGAINGGPIATARAEVVSVPLQGSPTPTQTFLWESRNAKAVLIMIPGGEGHLGLTPGKTNLGGFYGNALRPLADGSKTSGTSHVAIFDSPDILPVGDIYPTSRTMPEHLSRIESVVRFYKERFAKPIWLMGHSNGAASVAEFLRTRAELVDGAVFSSSRRGIKVSTSVAMPVLFMHHRQDLCPKADPTPTVDQFEAMKKSGKTNTAFVWIEGGAREDKNPCASGYHMYFGAEAAAFSAIDAFMGKY